MKLHEDYVRHEWMETEARRAYNQQNTESTLKADLKWERLDGGRDQKGKNLLLLISRQIKTVLSKASN